jgi:hypothetical protein
MSKRLTVTELDFDAIKTNLKEFLKSQSQFTDYNFEGSNFSVLLDLLAYNTHYNAYYLNMVANEAFLDTALLRDSVVSHAKSLGYTPKSVTTSKAIVNLTVETFDTTPATLVLPRGFVFRSNLIDNRSYNFVTLEETLVTKSNTQFVFENLEIFEGQIVNFVYNYSELDNPKQIFTIEDGNVDTSTIRVTVRPNSSNTNFEVYGRAEDLLEVTGDSLVFFLQESKNGKFQIYFGNGVIGKKLQNDSVVEISYLVSSGLDPNGANGFTPIENINGFSSFIVDVVSVASGASDREEVDSIKLLAPSQYVSQNRLVTKNDYGTFLQRNYFPADSISVWGGEEQPQKAYGKIFISIKPKEGFFISESEKRRIISDIIQPKNVAGTNVEILDPDFLYIKTNSIVKYDRSKTTRNSISLANAVRQSIIDYKNTSINKFGSNFVLSKMENQISTVDNSIIGTETKIRVEKRIVPNLGTTSSYIIDFGVPLNRGTLLNRLVSNDFRISDGGVLRIAQIEETPQSFTGVEQILITDPGFGYTRAPTVTITGDGFGATAEATVVNGKIQSIQITNRGVNYTQAIVTISGGGGAGASATALVSSRIGNLRVVYFDANAEKKIINPNVGTINYDTGQILINDLNINSLVSGPFLKLDVESNRTIIESARNIIITIDDLDPSSIIVSVEESDGNYR